MRQEIVMKLLLVEKPYAAPITKLLDKLINVL